MRFFACLMVVAASVSTPASAQHEAWSTSWAASVQGPYPVGNPSAQPDQRFAFPTPPTGANDQTFRLVVRPDLWGRQARLRLSNAFGTSPVTFDGIFIGLQLGGAAVVPRTNQPVRFGGEDGVTIAPGEWVWSDPVTLPFVADPGAPSLAGRKLAVSFHIVGESGPMTWHAKALQTSYVTARGAGGRGQEEGEAAFPFSTASWFFLDAVDMTAPAGTPVIIGFGDSITDGTASTMNGDDRWPDVLSRRLHAAYGNRVAVVNAGIGGNQVAGPFRPQSGRLISSPGPDSTFWSGTASTRGCCRPPGTSALPFLPSSSMWAHRMRSISPLPICFAVGSTSWAAISAGATTRATMRSYPDWGWSAGSPLWKVASSF